MFKCRECGLVHEERIDAKYCCLDPADNAIYGEPEEPEMVKEPYSFCSTCNTLLEGEESKHAYCAKCQDDNPNRF